MSGLPSSVLFACNHNAIRSPMAEAMAKRLYGQTAYLDSVGVQPAELDSFAVAVLDEIGIDLHGHHGKSFDDIDPSSFDLILVPGAAFTADGDRLGRGAGVRDPRLRSQLPVRR